MGQMARWLRRLPRELFAFEAPATRGGVWHLRLLEVVAIGLTLHAVWTWAPFIQRIEAVVLPLGLAHYLDVSVFFDHGLSFVVAAVLSAGLALGFTRRSRYGYAVALACFHLMYVSRYSLGEISHGSNFLGMAVLALAVGTWAFHARPTGLPTFVFGFLTFFYGIGYTSAGVCKLVATGLDWPAAAHMSLWLGERTIDVTSSLGSFSLNPVQRAIVDYPVLGSAALTFGLVVELVGILAWWPPLRPWVFSALIVMHLGVDATLNIYFGDNVYLLALLAYPWARLFDRLAPPAQPRVQAA